MEIMLGLQNAIKLNNKWYDETKFNTELKNAIVQVSNYQKQINNLNADIQNCKILVAHHAKFIQDNVPASAEIDEPKVEGTATEAPVEEPKE